MTGEGRTDREQLARNWRRIETFLRAAMASVEPPCPPDAGRFLDENELFLAWDVLRDAAAAGAKIKPPFQPCMDEAARLMGLGSA